MAQQDEIPKHKLSMDKVIKSAEDITSVIQTVEHDHGKTYYDSAEEVLRDEKTGHIDYKRLDAKKHGDKYQKLMAKKMHDKYLDKIVKKFNIDLKGKSDADKDILTHGFFGVNEGILLEMLAAYGPSMTHETYKKQHIDEHIQKLSAALVPRIYAHISSEDIPKMLKEVGADKHLTGDLKDYAKPEYRADIATLIQKHHSGGGAITLRDIAETKYLKNFYKEPKINYAEKKKAA